MLESVLRDLKQHPMVRHEAAEAMGAISSLASLPVLREFLTKEGECLPVTETCEIAIAKIEYDHSSDNERSRRSAYDSIDPAPPSSMHDTNQQQHKATDVSVKKLRENLLDRKKSLFERYRAMFALRNDGGEEAVLALADGFADDSALFR